MIAIFNPEQNEGQLTAKYRTNVISEGIKMCSEYLISFQTTSGKIMLPSFGIKKCNTRNVEEEFAILKMI